MAFKDTHKILRHAVYDLLNGTITYDGNPVGVYDEMNDGDDVYILLSTQQEVADETSDAFITRSSIDIEVVAKTGTTVSKDVIDDISDDIYQLLRPSPDTTGLVPSAGFLIHNVTRESAITLTTQVSSTQTIIRKIIKIVTTIVQQ